MSDLYFIGNAHLDPVWLWRWQEGYSEIISTFRSALDRMNDFPDFKFTSACSAYYQWVEKIDPEMFKEIQQRVKEGRWNIVGGWVIQPDCNIPDGESFARHALISQRYFKEKFGVTVKTGYNVDSFGHNANLPKILNKSGIENYVFMRPDRNEKDIAENVFMWESSDGSKLKTYRIHDRYNVDHTTYYMIDEVRELAKKTGKDHMVFYGIGNHGGGPTIALIDDLKNMLGDEFKMSTPDEYFKKIDAASLITVKEELQHHARGCYAACAFVKKNNRRSENNLVVAEKMSLMAKELTGTQYPKKKLEKAWRNILFNQFHDIMGGCSIKKAYDDAGHLYGETMSITEQAIFYAMNKISRNIDTLKGETLPAYRKNHWQVWEHEVLGTPVIVFNPHDHKVKVAVQVNAKATMMTDCNGNEIPFQIVRGDYVNTAEKHHTAFIAKVEPMGYAVYRLFCEKQATLNAPSKVTATKNSLENDLIKVEFDEVTGDIKSFYDKEKQEYIISAPCKAVVLDDTDNDTWAHNKFDLGPTVGMFEKPEFAVTETGPVRATLRIKSTYNASTLVRDFTITPDSKVVTVKAKFDFREKHRVVKMAFPTGAKEVISKIPYGTVTRPMYTGEEPCGSWFAADRLCVANDSKYCYDTSDGYVRLTALRSAIFADHYAGQYRDEFCEYMEQGESEFSYAVYPYESNVKAERTAAELNYTLPTFKDSFHKGDLPETYCGLKVEGEDIVISAIKQAEDNDDKVIHLYEMNGKDTSAAIKLFGKEVKTALTHNQLKVLSDKGKELNLIEWEE